PRWRRRSAYSPRAPTSSPRAPARSRSQPPFAGTTAASASSAAGTSTPTSTPGSSVRQQRHREARVAAEQDSARDRRAAVTIADRVDGGVDRLLRPEQELAGPGVLEHRHRAADERDAALLDQRRRRREEGASRDQDRLRVRGRERQRVRARRALEVAEAEAKYDRPSDPARRPHPPRDPVDDGDERRVDCRGRVSPAPEGTLRADRAAPPAGFHAAEIAVVRERVQLTAGRPAEHRDERRLREGGELTDRPHVP